MKKRDRLKWLTEYLAKTLATATFTVTVGSVLDDYIFEFGLGDRRAFADLELVCRRSGYTLKDGAVRLPDPA